MTTRTTFNGASTEVTGVALLTQYDAHVGRFYNASALRLSSIAGTPNVITAVVDPVLDVGLVAGMNFWLEPTANNTGTVTLAIGSEVAQNVVDATGTALESGDMVSGTTYALHYTGTELRIVSKGDVAPVGTTLTYDVFTTSGTLTKPNAFPDVGLLLMEAWGGGSGGAVAGAGAGGGGGAYNWKWYRGVDIDTTETITIGGGGAIATAGGNTSVGSLCSAFGGGAESGQFGGGGGGQSSAGGASGASGSPSGGATSGTSGNVGAGGNSSVDGGDGIFGGAGGGGANGGGSGGDSFYGGAGGGGQGGSGGTSVFGGDGGAAGVGGAIPAGGGGQGAAGARGEVRVRWMTG